MAMANQSQGEWTKYKIRTRMNKSNIKLIYEKHLKTAEGTRTVRVNTPPKKGNHRDSLTFYILWLGEYDNS